MSEKPISFSPLMVRAILEGRKTQTRRILKPQPKWDNGALGIEDAKGRWVFCTNTEVGFAEGLLRSKFKARYESGDHLWVREAWRTGKGFNPLSPSELGPRTPLHYLADGEQSARVPLTGRYRHARFIPRWASRITLKVTDVRVQRLQDISEDDAKSEGIEPVLYGGSDPQFQGACAWKDYRDHPHAVVPYSSPIHSFQSLWNSINGPGAWDTNPWVAAYTFERINP